VSNRSNLEPILNLLAINPPPGPDPRGLSISGIAFDSREVKPGYAFVCLPGEHTDGNQFIPEAIKNGAACVFTEQKNASGSSVPIYVVPDSRQALAILADHFWDHPSRKLRPLGVTGTNGKTTTTHLIEYIMNAAGHKTGLMGTLGARWPGHEGYQNIKHTTPQSADLHKTLAQMVDERCTHVAMEVSSHALVQKRVGECHFASACLTNITQDHLDFHITMENYWKAKRLLFEELNESVHGNKSAVVNLDDPLAGEFLRPLRSGVRKLTYGWDSASDLSVRNAEFDFSGTKLSLQTPEGELTFKMRLSGRFNVYNTMAAMLVCNAEGLTFEQCAQTLEEFSGVSGRFEVVSTGSSDEPLCVVDYAHTPDGLENVLKTARNIVPEGGRLICVFGCGGDRDPSKRPQMGEISESYADEVVVTSDNPRTEDPQQIIANILAGIRRTNRVKVESDRATAIRMAIHGASHKDVVVVAGKGHENYQILADKTIPFDDRTEVRLALEERASTLAQPS
jgi:UDP-N-acetylmuramoyl-L-alanyl-D-glutamate--2,6-diaminopimelate ligase